MKANECFARLSSAGLTPNRRVDTPRLLLHSAAAPFLPLGLVATTGQFRPLELQCVYADGTPRNYGERQ